MQFKYIIKNGELVEKEKANVSVFNKAMFFDFAVYSNIKVVQGKMFVPELEIEKLFESAEVIGLKHKFSKKEIVSWMKKLIEKNDLKDALVRLLLIGPEKDSEPILFIFPVGLTFYPDKFYKEGVKLITFNGERHFPTSKTKDLLMSYIAFREAQKHGAFDALLVDKDGNVREGTRTSFYVIKGNTLIVPPKEKVLEGITRKIILKIASKILKVKEMEIPLKGLGKYDEYFLSGTSPGIMPVSHINGKKVGNGVGSKTKRLQKLYRVV